MTKIKDVITVKVPFPDINSNLAVNPHMYLCIQDGVNKKFLSCQTRKPMLLAKSRPPFRYVDENVDSSRNPFKRATLIGCDYAFCFDKIHVSSRLLTATRRDVCDEVYEKVLTEIHHDKFINKSIDTTALISINPGLSIISSK